MFNSTNNIAKCIINYSDDATNNYKINKIHNVKKTYRNPNDYIKQNT